MARMGSQTDRKRIANRMANHRNRDRKPIATESPSVRSGSGSDPIREEDPSPWWRRRVGWQTRRAAPRAVEAPSAPLPCPTGHRPPRPPSGRRGGGPDRRHGREAALSAAAAPMGAAIVERLRREGVTIDELPRIAAVIGADGGRLCGRGPRPPRDDRPPRKARFCPTAGWDAPPSVRPSPRHRDGGVEASAAARLRPPVPPAGATGWPTCAPHGYPRATSRATLPRSRRPKSKTRSSAAPPSRPSAWLRRCTF